MAAEGDRAAAGAGHDVLGVVVAEEAAGAVTGGVQALDDLVLGVQDLHLLVDAQAVDGGQEAAAVPAAEEGRVAQLGEAVGLLAEVGVLLGVVQVVVVRDLGQEGLLGVALEAQLVGQLLDGVGHEDGALLDLVGEELLEGDVGLGGQLLLDLARAADGVEAGDVLTGVVVEHLAEHAALLLGGRVEVEVVGRGLVAVATAVAGDLEEGLRADVVLLALASEGAGALGGHVAGALAGLHQAAVEEHGGGVLVLLGADPHGGLDAVARVVGVVVGQGHDAVDDGREGLAHGGVGRVAARGQQHAVGGVDAHVTVGGLEDAARDAAGLVLLQLDQGGLIAHAVAQGVDVALEDLVAHDLVALGVVSGVVVLGEGDVVVGAARGVLVVGVQGAGHTGLGEQLVEPVDHRGALVDPDLPDAGVALARGVAHELVEQLALVVGHAGGLAVLGVDGAQPVTGLAHHGALLGDDEVHAQLGGGGGGGHAAVAGAHDEQLALAGLDDVGLGDLGGGAQPVLGAALGVLGLGLLGDGHGEAASGGGHGGGGGSAGEEGAAGHFHR